MYSSQEGYYNIIKCHDFYKTHADLCSTIQKLVRKDNQAKISKNRTGNMFTYLALPEKERDYNTVTTHVNMVTVRELRRPE